MVPVEFNRRLIFLVKKHPCIWHKRSDRKAYAWRMIEKEMEPVSFCSIRQLQISWSNLRKEYFQEIFIRTIERNFEAPTWIYFHDMTFLYHTVKQQIRKKLGGISPPLFQPRSNLDRSQNPRCPCCIHDDADEIVITVEIEHTNESRNNTSPCSETSFIYYHEATDSKRSISVRTIKAKDSKPKSYSFRKPSQSQQNVMENSLIQSTSQNLIKHKIDYEDDTNTGTINESSNSQLPPAKLDNLTDNLPPIDICPSVQTNQSIVLNNSVIHENSSSPGLNKLPSMNECVEDSLTLKELSDATNCTMEQTQFPEIGNIFSMDEEVPKHIEKPTIWNSTQYDDERSKIIKAIEANPEVYIESFSDTEAYDNAWQRVADAVGSLSVGTIQIRWKNIRSRYLRELLNKKESTWKWFEDMAFFRPQMHKLVDDINKNQMNIPKSSMELNAKSVTNSTKENYQIEAATIEISPRRKSSIEGIPNDQPVILKMKVEDLTTKKYTTSSIERSTKCPAATYNTPKSKAGYINPTSDAEITKVENETLSKPVDPYFRKPYQIKEPGFVNESTLLILQNQPDVKIEESANDLTATCQLKVENETSSFITPKNVSTTNSIERSSNDEVATGKVKVETDDVTNEISTTNSIKMSSNDEATTCKVKVEIEDVIEEACTTSSIKCSSKDQTATYNSAESTTSNTYVMSNIKIADAETSTLKKPIKAYFRKPKRIKESAIVDESMLQINQNQADFIEESTTDISATCKLNVEIENVTKNISTSNSFERSSNDEVATCKVKVEIDDVINDISTTNSIEMSSNDDATTCRVKVEIEDVIEETSTTSSIKSSSKDQAATYNSAKSTASYTSVMPNIEITDAETSSLKRPIKVYFRKPKRIKESAVVDESMLQVFENQVDIKIEESTNDISAICKPQLEIEDATKKISTTNSIEMSSNGDATTCRVKVEIEDVIEETSTTSSIKISSKDQAATYNSAKSTTSYTNAMPNIKIKDAETSTLKRPIKVYFRKPKRIKDSAVVDENTLQIFENQSDIKIEESTDDISAICKPQVEIENATKKISTTNSIERSSNDEVATCEVKVETDDVTNSIEMSSNVDATTCKVKLEIEDVIEEIYTASSIKSSSKDQATTYNSAKSTTNYTNVMSNIKISDAKTSTLKKPIKSYFRKPNRIKESAFVDESMLQILQKQPDINIDESTNDQTATCKVKLEIEDELLELSTASPIERHSNDQAATYNSANSAAGFTNAVSNIFNSRNLSKPIKSYFRNPNQIKESTVVDEPSLPILQNQLDIEIGENTNRQANIYNSAKIKTDCIYLTPNISRNISKPIKAYFMNSRYLSKPIKAHLINSEPVKRPATLIEKLLPIPQTQSNDITSVQVNHFVHLTNEIGACGESNDNSEILPTSKKLRLSRGSEKKDKIMTTNKAHKIPPLYPAPSLTLYEAATESNEEINVYKYKNEYN